MLSAIVITFLLPPLVLDKLRVALFPGADNGFFYPSPPAQLFEPLCTSFILPETDAIHYKVKEDHRYITKAAYVVLGIQMDGRKDILGVWIGENESAKFWMSVMNDLRNRGVLDVYVFCVDGLTGFREAISAVFPKSQIQRCIIHQIRSSTKYVNYKDIRAVMADLKRVYGAVNEDEAANALAEFKEKWVKTYPSCVRSWEENWDILSTFYTFRRYKLYKKSSQNPSFSDFVAIFLSTI